jgi:hypothetical protein
MKFDQTPHPLTEDHYHIQNLINGQEKRTADRVYHQNRVKALEERDKEIASVQDMVLTDFYCERCGKDFKAQAVKQIETDWTNSSQKVAYYKTKCFQGHWCIRLITDKNKDAFWTKSKQVAIDRGKGFNDMIQPGETNFNLLYGHK